MKFNSLKDAIVNNLPKIEGVVWQCDCYRVPDSLGIGILVGARFEVEEGLPVQETLGQIVDKLHQIASNGQIRLELERY